jgi:uncharacterized protein YbaA (DUF1428 family)
MSRRVTKVVTAVAAQLTDEQGARRCPLRECRSDDLGAGEITTNAMKAALAEGQVEIGTWVNLIRNPAVLALL